MTGLALFVGAGAIADLVAAVEGHVITDVGLVRIAGMAVAIIGWFYVAGGRTGAASFGLATVADRALVPLFLVPVWWWGEAPATLTLSFAALDPLLAVGAWLVWRASDDATAASESPPEPPHPARARARQDRHAVHQTRRTS